MAGQTACSAETIHNTLYEDRRGRIWASTHRGVGYLEGERFVPIDGIPGSGTVHAIVEDTTGNVWIADQNRGLFRVSSAGAVQAIPWRSVGRGDFAMTLAADPASGGLWLGLRESGLVHFVGGNVRESYSVADGRAEPRINDLRFDQDGALWVATQSGLSRLRNGHLAKLTAQNGLPCEGVHWSVEDDAHAVWLFMPCGLVRVSQTNLVARLDRGETGAMRPDEMAVFDDSDGVRSVQIIGGYGPRVGKSADGKLWFTVNGTLSVVDPGHLPFNRLAPPVHIERIAADRKTYDAASAALGLPALTRDLEIDYTALSLVSPEKNQFSIRLDGRDREWQDVGTRRQVYYNDLPPRHYRFRVMASNNNGVWNETGASLEFSIAPAYYQTTWFRATLLIGGLALLVGLYRLRLRQVAHAFDVRLQERVNERTRIARELHDTLLQSFQGLMLRLQVVEDNPAGRKSQASTRTGARTRRSGDRRGTQRRL